MLLESLFTHLFRLCLYKVVEYMTLQITTCTLHKYFFSYFALIISGIFVLTSRDMGYLEKIIIGIFATLLKGI